MNSQPSALLISLDEAESDPALLTRGDRKLLVTEVYETHETQASHSSWRHPEEGEKCPVLLTEDTEMAVFTERAKQTRHYHKTATEIYSLLKGKMTIEVAGLTYELEAGDTIVVNPGSRHEVMRTGNFLCQVITVNCGGPSDRFED